MTLAVWSEPSWAPRDRAAGLVAAPGAGRWLDSVLGPWYAVAPTAVRLVPPSDAAVAVLPFSLEAVELDPGLGSLVHRFVDEARSAGLVTIAFCRGDAMTSAPRGTVVLRTSVERRGRNPLDVAAPPWILDPADEVPVGPRPYRAVPSVAFTGQAHPIGTGAASWTRFLVRCAATGLGIEERLGIPAAHPARPWTIGWLRRCTGVEVRVDRRPDMVRPDIDNPVEARQSFLRAVASADYGVGVRGLGNYSYRLYESLAAGRPVLLAQSGAPLPRATDVDWPRLTVPGRWILAPALGRRLLTHHGRLTPTSWATLQRDCRTAWTDHLSPLGFLSGVATSLSDLAARGGARDPDLVAAALR